MAMATTPKHKQNFISFIEPNYARVGHVNPGEHRDHFQAFLDTCLAIIPNDSAGPADPYMYNAHMGSFVRHLDEAKDAFVKAHLAFYTSRNSNKRKEQ